MFTRHTKTPPLTEEPSGNEEIKLQTPVRSFSPFGLPVLAAPPHARRRVFIRLVAIIALVVIVGAGVYVLFHTKAPAAHTTQQATSTVRHASSSSGAKVEPVSTQSYTATNFNLSFNYPTGWLVVNSGTGPMTVTSPPLQLTDADGSIVTGEITMTIQPQGQLPASFSAGTVLAVLNSQEITYKQPTASQASQTYLSFVQYSSTTTKGGLDGIYVTGNYGYKKAQIIPGTDITNVNPLVTITFTKCGNSACSMNLTPLTIESTLWSKSSFQAPILTMLRSFAFQ
jgi:hypothetical protein